MKSVAGILSLGIACSDTPDAAPPEKEGTPTDTGAASSFPEVPDAVDLDSAEGAVRVELVAGRVEHEILGVFYDGFGYNGMSPGPTIRATLGDTVTIEFRNALDESTTVHWHGVSVPNEMDGAAWIDSPVPAGAGFTYSFVVNQPGTFWYHPHLDVSRQVDLGLYGALVVTNPADPTVDRDLVLVVDAWSEFDEEDPDHHDLPPSPEKVVWTVNGVVEPSLELADTERVRARVINVSNTSYLQLNWPGTIQIAGDQGLLAAAGPAESVLVAPGNRADFEVVAGVATGGLSTRPFSASGGESYGEERQLLSMSDSGIGQSADWPFSGQLPSVYAGYSDIVYVFSGSGGAGAWQINGESWPVVTPVDVALGREVFIEVRNLSTTNHPFHLHGHRFEVVEIDGFAPAVQRWADTVDVGIRSTVRLRLVADNPGEWLVHCHLLGHEDAGMMTLLRVE